MSIVVCVRCGRSNSEFDVSCAGCGLRLDAAARSTGAAAKAVEAPEAAVSAGAEPERRCGPYRVVKRLGRGGMGVVHLAVHESTGAQVALKTVRLANPALLDSLRREIRALSRLRHPGVARIVDQGLDEGLPWYAMELVQGPNLRTWSGKALRPSSPAATEPEEWWTCASAYASVAAVPPDAPALDVARLSQPQTGHTSTEPGQNHKHGPQVLNLVRRLCGPLAYLHGEGLVHRDLKPENVLVVENAGAGASRPVIVDFGLAGEFAASFGREHLDAAGEAAGTVAYMAPEQIRGHLVDARADLYALGCILYELLTGRPPFVGQNPVQVVKQHLEAQPEQPSMHGEGISAELDAVVLRLLAKDPRERYGHADDVAAALGELGAEAVEEEPGTPQARAYVYRPGFAGRAEVVQRLNERLDRLQAGAGGVVLIAGESGSGKTRLALELAREAGRRKLLVLTGECLPGAASADGARSDSAGLAGNENARAGSEARESAGAGVPGLQGGLESARAPRSAADRSPSFARAGGPLEALRKPLQAVADRCRARGVEATERLLGRRAKVLSPYEPVLSSLPGQDAHPEPAELPVDAARLRVFTSLTETLAALAKEESLVLLLDDLQWGDELTLGWLQHWLRSWEAGAGSGGPVLILGTARSEDEAWSGPSLLRELAHGEHVETVVLGRLDEEAVASMVGDMLALRPAPPLFSSFVAKQSEGNPFFVAEYLRAMLEPGPEAQSPLLWRDGSGRWQVAEPGGGKAGLSDYEALPLPRTLRELVSRRLEGLPEPSQRLVEAAAVLGREMELELLLRTVASAETDSRDVLLDSISGLQRRQILEESGPGLLRFAHDKIRELGYEAIEPGRRAQLHQRGAESIEAVHTNLLAQYEAALGIHWEQAGHSSRACPYYLAAARTAVLRYDPVQAERSYRRYLELAESASSESLRARFELADRILFPSGRTNEAISELQRALSYAQRSRDRVIEAETQRALGEMYRQTGRAAHAQQFLEQAVCLAEETGDQQLQARALMCMASVHYELGQVEQTWKRLEQALGLARHTGNRRLEGSVLGNSGAFHLNHGRPAQARECLEQALAIHRELGNRRAEAMVLGNLCICHREQGRWEQARQCIEESLAQHREAGDRRMEAHVMGLLGALHVDQGRAERAGQLYEQALALHREMGNRRYEGVLLGHLGVLQSRLGQTAQALEHYEQALQIHQEVGNRRFEAVELGNLGRLHLNQGGLEVARVFLERAIRLHREEHDLRNEALAFLDVGHLHLRQGQLERARALYAQALGTFRELGHREYIGCAIACAITLERLAGTDPGSLEGVAREAEELLESVGQKRELAKLLCELGHVRLSAGHSGSAFLARAKTIVEELDARRDCELSRCTTKLLRTQEAFEAGEQVRLFRGELIDDLPEGVRRWLRETGQL